MYQFEIAGYASWGRKALQWSPDRIQQVKQTLKKTFFERHPRYLPLRKLMTPRLTPKLYADFAHYECMRQTVLELVSALEQEQSQCWTELRKVA